MTPAFLFITPLRYWILRAQLWLILNKQFWLAMHLPHIIRWAVAAVPIALLVGEYIREIIWIWRVPARAMRLADRGETDRAIALMRRSVRAITPLLNTRPLQVRRLYSLGMMLENSRRTGEANEVWEEILGRTGLAPAFEAEVRKRLANGQETLGDTGAAMRQRALIEDRLKQGEHAQGEDDWSLLYERGKLAADAKRVKEAKELFERALAAPKMGVPHSKRGPIDVEIACRLALASYDDGDTDRAESAARFAIEGANSPFWRGQAFRTLALTLGTQNRIEEAIEASSASLVEVQKEGNSDRLADARGNHAMLLMQVGQVRTALAECEAAVEMGTHNSRTALHIASNCAALLGDYDGARSYLEKARQSVPFTSPAAERQTQGLFDVEQANVEMAATRHAGENRAQIAWDLLQRAKPRLEGFERILYWVSASECLCLVLIGQSDVARANLARVEAQLPGYEGDVATQNAIWTWLARTNMELGEWSAAEKWARTYLDSGLGRPVYRPSSLCDLGECLRAQGFESAARDCWQEAVQMGFDIADTRRACELLELQ